KRKKEKKEIVKVLKYSERLEEVLFYVGKDLNNYDEIKTHISSDLYNYKTRFLKVINLILNYKRFFSPVYFRTASITKSKLENDINVMFEYLSRIVLDLSIRPRTYYKIQKEKDRDYYGLEVLYKKSLESVNTILNIKTDEFRALNPLHILKLFSFFISTNTDSIDDYNFKLKKIEKLKKKALELRNERLNNLIEAIEFVFNRNDFEIAYSKTLVQSGLRKCLKDAINKRNLNQNIIRLFNSSGDGLDGLYIDLYNKDAVIIVEYTILSSKDLLNIITKTLKSKIPDLNSVYLKFSWWFDKTKYFDRYIYKSRKWSEELIKCEEGELKILVNSKSSKSGFFIDNRNIRNYISKICNGKSLLNLCSFTCTLGAIGRLNNAKKVINLEKYNHNLELGKIIYESNNLSYEDNEFVCSTMEDFFEKEVEEKFDIIVLDLPEVAAIPAFVDNIRDFYINRNQSALKYLKDGGILITSCCSHGFNRQKYEGVINKLVINNNLKLIDIKLEMLEDHPVDLKKRNDYLKIKVLQKKSNNEDSK
ncbi:MAG: hypothetical protein GY932_11160, partial [Arcobacter sp.]|nr:hypothetical protein [Arcobacter sp.]